MEPQGPSHGRCLSNGLTVEIEYKVRSGWTMKSSDENYVSAVFKQGGSSPLYKVEGQYTKELFGTDLRTREKKSIFKATPKMANADKMFGMDITTL